MSNTSGALQGIGGCHSVRDYYRRCTAGRAQGPLLTAGRLTRRRAGGQLPATSAQVLYKFGPGQPVTWSSMFKLYSESSLMAYMDTLLVVHRGSY